MIHVNLSTGLNKQIRINHHYTLILYYAEGGGGGVKMLRGGGGGTEIFSSIKGGL